MRGARWNALCKPIIQPLKVREFISEFLPARGISKKMCTALLTRLLNESAYEFPFMNWERICHRIKTLL